jgi:hypothetical protein
MKLTIRELKEILRSRIYDLPDEVIPGVRRLDYKIKMERIHNALAELESQIYPKENNDED